MEIGPGAPSPARHAVIEEQRPRAGRPPWRRPMEPEPRPHASRAPPATGGVRADEPRLVGDSAAIAGLIDRIDAIAHSDAHVLVTGESGTGKELVAHMLHARSARRERPFVALNCAAFPETLLEAELFGHERGAFTGAHRKRDGRFQAADRGTLFLDEVAEIPAAAQAKLLRVLQEGTFEPLGTNRSVRVDVRMISATHRDLRERIARGLFREDLFYRLNVLELRIAPLRERREDIPLLVEHFLARLGGAARPAIRPAALAALRRHDFPGNVRELEHAILHAVVLARGADIDLEHLPPAVARAPLGAPAAIPASASPSRSRARPLADALREFERDYVLKTLRLASGRRAVASAMLGISRKNLWEKLRRHGIAPAEIVAES